MSLRLEDAGAALAARFGRPAELIARAPGRVNLIGEHTDYNDGFVLPIATQHATFAAAARTAAPGPSRLRAYSADLDEEHAWKLGRWREQQLPRWTGYIAGVAEILSQRGVPVESVDLLFWSAVPIGAGLSSSAALSVATAIALARLGQAQLTPHELAAVCRRAEHEYAGVPCGVMDQLASLAGHDGAALLLDCRTLAYEHVPLPAACEFIVVNSGVRHELASGEYAERRRQCAEAVAYLRGRDPAVKALRDVTERTIAEHADRLPPLIAARARHVTSENRRTLEAAAALRQADLPTFGRLMNESHQSLRDDYQVSIPELDLLVELMREVPGVLGARMTGGGFGGSIVALAHSGRDLKQVEDLLRRRYATSTRHARAFIVRAGAGASVVLP